MIFKKAHIVLYLILLVCFCNNTFGLKPFQTPQTFRHFEDNFKDKYKTERYNYEGVKVIRQTPDGSGNYEEYENKDTKIKEESDEEYWSINLGGFGWIFYIILALAVIYLVYILLNEGGTGLFSSGRNKTIKNYEDITAENIEEADINTLIKHAEKDNNYRLAVRYYYLLVLKTLSLNNHIKYEDDKTNAEYLSEIENKTFSSSFAYTSYLYNYIWYGEFTLSPNQYKKAKTNFTTLLKQVE
ncbi:hypothetical protein E1J38_006820 [Seonamhaeicola sediminis]|uniref:DUF4129 domain-containing protein n=1 Tax=Seonamhaeicola sediminis TaxID=2528206 RepID=A0A562YD63_9FLAO|nr:hypothetical protein [Seonamhaeicola sediminis]TWO32578.1 hypothetical protein E1J38_006820 [Seonamhaeicola sediminis]